MAERAWDAFLARWTWDAIGPRIRAAATDCLEAGHRIPAAQGLAAPHTEKSLTRA